jgi:hypothetical protein
LIWAGRLYASHQLLVLFVMRILFVDIIFHCFIFLFCWCWGVVGSDRIKQFHVLLKRLYHEFWKVHAHLVYQASMTSHSYLSSINEWLDSKGVSIETFSNHSSNIMSSSRIREFDCEPWNHSNKIDRGWWWWCRLNI